jgi:hypothetical protein
MSSVRGAQSVQRSQSSLHNWCCVGTRLRKHGGLVGALKTAPNRSNLPASEMVLGSRHLLGVRLVTSGIEEPSLESGAGPLGQRLRARFARLHGDGRPSCRKGCRHVRGQSDSQHHQRRRRECDCDLFKHDQPPHAHQALLSVTHQIPQ